MSAVLDYGIPPYFFSPPSLFNGYNAVVTTEVDHKKSVVIMLFYSSFPN